MIDTADIGGDVSERPKLRGVLHAVAFGVSCVVGILFVASAPAAHAFAAATFAVTASLMLGTSTLYHRVTWGPRGRLWMRRADHAGVFLLIAGTYTPVALISLHGAWRSTVLAVVWSGAIVATLAKMCWVAAPKWLSAVVGVALGWAGVVAMPQLAHNEGIAPLVLLGAGGLAYTAGAVVYARRRPDPLPRVFGYHELFHALTIVALVCQYVAVAVFIVGVD
ncbi:MAG TPA: hemolysin III family protein [Gaiellaceae bacterium]|jgi:hemolysin III